MKAGYVEVVQVNEKTGERGRPLRELVVITDKGRQYCSLLILLGEIFVKFLIGEGDEKILSLILKWREEGKD